MEMPERNATEQRSVKEEIGEAKNPGRKIGRKEESKETWRTRVIGGYGGREKSRDGGHRGERDGDMEGQLAIFSIFSHREMRKELGLATSFLTRTKKSRGKLVILDSVRAERSGAARRKRKTLPLEVSLEIAPPYSPRCFPRARVAALFTAAST